MHQRLVRYSNPTTRSRVRLFCLPYAGGSTASFQPWRALLPPGLEVCVVSPGLYTADDTRAFASITELADAVTAAIEPWLDAPFAIFGHSLGAAVAFEVARRLETSGHTPLHLFVSARRSPHVPPASTRIAGLSDVALVNEVQARYGGIPAAVLAETELMTLLLPRLRAELKLNEEYLAPVGAVCCALTAFGGANDPTVSVADLDQWARCTRSRFRRHLVPGGHFFIKESPAAVLPIIHNGLLEALSSSVASA